MAELIVTREELERRYQAGERKFWEVCLYDADLSDMDLTGAVFYGADFRRATFRGSTLKDAMLQNSDLTEADFRDANLSGINLWRSYLESAQFCRANLKYAGMVGTFLRYADLTDANLVQADLQAADMTGARFIRAKMDSAMCMEANLLGSDLTGANLNGANLHAADLSGVVMRDAICAEVVLGDTRLIAMDLSSLCAALSTITFVGKSTVDYESVVLSMRAPKLKTFLQRSGMPEVFVEYMVSCAQSLNLKGEFSVFKSTFICYGGPDEPFAKKLSDALSNNGVTTFLFAEHAVAGQKLHRVMRRGVNGHDRVILICSKDSLDRKGVLNEIEETLTREARDGGEAYLIPIRLDNYVFSGWKPPDPEVAQAVQSRVVADFEGADTDQSKFDAGLLRLIAALKK